MLALLLPLLVTGPACGDSSEENMKNQDESQWSEWPQNGNQESSNGPLVDKIRAMLKTTESRIETMLAGIEERFMKMIMNGAPVGQAGVAQEVAEGPIERRRRKKEKASLEWIMSQRACRKNCMKRRGKQKGVKKACREACKNNTRLD